MPDHPRNSSFILTGDFTAYLQTSSSFTFPLGNEQNLSLALTETQLGLPSVNSVVDAAFALGFPQVLAFATACMGLYFAIKLLGSFTP